MKTTATELPDSAARSPHRRSGSSLWFAEDGGFFHGDEPSYFDPVDFNWVAELESHWETIRDELGALLESADNELKPYANTAMASAGPASWRTYTMMFWYQRNDANCHRCPKTWALLKDIPGLCAASFNLLEPHTTIKPHYGDTNAIVRCHMGLVIPGAAPKCAFRVREDVRSWEEGRLLMFCDAHQHTAWNNTDQRRYILVLDVMRPQYAAHGRSIASRVRASISLGVALQQSAWLKKHCSQGWARRLLLRVLQLRYRLQLALQM